MKYEGMEQALGGAAAASMKAELAERVDAIQAGLSACQSPIEHALACALATNYMSGGMGAKIGDSEILSGAGRNTYIEILPQFQVGMYRADFIVSLLCHHREGGPSVIVECDGHDYHERTKEQAEHDKSRDRFMQSAGHHVLRFTGREIHRNAAKCAREVMALLIARGTEAMQRGGTA